MTQPNEHTLLLAAVYIHLQAIAARGCEITFKRELSYDGKREAMLIRVNGVGADGADFKHYIRAPWPCIVNEDICAPLRELKQVVEDNCHPLPRLRVKDKPYGY